MAIIYDKESRHFTLQTKDTTYQMKVDPYGFLLHLYYGKKVSGNMDYLLTYYDRGFSGNPYEAEKDKTYSMDALPQEFPCQGNGDYRSPAFIVQNGDGTFACDLRYKSHEIRSGKYSLKGLPAVYAEEKEADTLEILLEDSTTGLQALLLYGVLEERDIITRSVKIINAGADQVYLEKVQPACLDFVTGDYDLITFYGRHAMERNYQRTAVIHGNHIIGSRRGTSSHQYNPMMILADKTTTENQGDCYAMSFVYSGGFKGETEKDQYNQIRMLLGLQEEQFRYPLKPSEEFISPEVVMTYTHEGLNRLSQNLHSCIRRHICRGKYRDTVRPVLLNSWEASYFDFTGASIYNLAKEAKEAGIELLVMDDGWFGQRFDDFRALGDWYVNEEKLGGTLAELVEKIHALDLLFGIWIEPEMVNEDSDLYREHPDWAFIIPGRKPNRSRYQLVLDFSRKEVVDYIFEQICSVFDTTKIDYVKWDINRSLGDVYSAVTKEQGRVMHDYVLGLYDFLERLQKRYPDMLIEGCSGGGGRFDAGMLYYTPQIWTSDNTDALDRIKIQYGTSFGYPLSSMSAHVSAVPNHQTGRTTSLRTRGVVAMTGSFGYELDPAKMTAEEKKEVRLQVEEYHRYAPLIFNGRYYRLTNPFESEVAAWAYVSEDRSEVLVNVVMQEIHGNMTVNYIKLQGLDEDARYVDGATGEVYYGDMLMNAGLPLKVEIGAYRAYQIYLKKEING